MFLNGFIFVMFFWLIGINEGAEILELNSTDTIEDFDFNSGDFDFNSGDFDFNSGINSNPMYIAFFPASVYGLPPKPASSSHHSSSYKPPDGILLAPPAPIVGNLLAPSPRYPPACNATSNMLPSVIPDE